MPFGAYGQFYDRFDVQWIFVGQGDGQAGPPEERSRR